jgi:hypothetical protein
MSSGAALMSMFGPMLEIGARVLLAIASGLLALVALRISARAICQGDAGVFLVGWALGIVGVCGAWIGFASLPLYRSSLMLQGVPDPMSGVGFWCFVQACEAPIALAIGSGVLIASCLRCGGGVGAAAGSSRDREARSRRIGAVGTRFERRLPTRQRSFASARSNAGPCPFRDIRLMPMTAQSSHF